MDDDLPETGVRNTKSGSREGERSFE